MVIVFWCLLNQILEVSDLEVDRSNEDLKLQLPGALEEPSN